MITRVVMKDVCERLAWARQAAGVSAREFARIAGMKAAHVRMIETGDRPRITAETAQRIAATIGATLDWLLNGTGRAPSAKHVRESVERKRSPRTVAA